MKLKEKEIEMEMEIDKAETHTWAIEHQGDSVKWEREREREIKWNLSIDICTHRKTTKRCQRNNWMKADREKRRSIEYMRIMTAVIGNTATTAYTKKFQWIFFCDCNKLQIHKCE